MYRLIIKINEHINNYSYRHCFLPEYHHVRGRLREGGDEAGEAEQSHEGEEEPGAAAATRPRGGGAKTVNTPTPAVDLQTHTQGETAPPTDCSAHYRQHPDDFSALIKHVRFVLRVALEDTTMVHPLERLNLRFLDRNTLQEKLKKQNDEQKGQTDENISP